MRNTFQAKWLVPLVLALPLLWLGACPGEARSVRPLSRSTAFVDPTLVATRAQSVSVILTGTDSAAASRAIEQVGGQVTSDLWLVDAVAATIPTANLATLAALPGVRSIVANSPVRASDGPYWGGYVSNVRKPGSTIALTATINSPATFLPDGGLVAVDQNGALLIANADGGIRAQVVMAGGPFTSAPVIAPDGSIYIAGQALKVYAYSPAGALRWQFAPGGANKFMGSPALGADGTVYVADTSRTLYALDPATGQARWQMKLSGAGSVVAAPAVGPDGVVYVDSDKGYVYAVNPGGAPRWSYNMGVAAGQSPVLAPSGLLYVANITGRVLFALNVTDGTLAWKANLAGPIRTNPIIGPDGGIYQACDGGLYGLNPDGTQRFYFSSPPPRGAPALSPDGGMVYYAAGQTLFGLVAATGVKRWAYATAGNIQDSPEIDPKGNVIVGTDQHMLYVVAANGVLVDDKLLDDNATQAASAAPSGDIAVRIGTNKIALLSLLSKKWTGLKDVEPTDLRLIWNLSNPVPIDVGADQVQNRSITGQGVTVAVVDSGVYFSGHVESILGAKLDHQFLGQADFVGGGQCNGTGSQFQGYCFTDHHNSKDSYGHGSHVAGIIWSNIIDASTNVTMGIAPGANILSVRALDANGMGAYADVIEAIQYVVANKSKFNIRVMNLSLSATPVTPYFVDPLNRAVEQAWANGIVVLAAAGNLGSAAETITVPGNDPYVITVGAVNDQRTPGYWQDDILPAWSSTGPTLDGFVKPDVLAPGSYIISFMYNDGKLPSDPRSQSSYLVKQYPDYSKTTSLFRMSGTSMATAIASGVAALMLQAHPELTPDQVKFRLKYSARPAVDDQSNPVYSLMQQGNGRIWAPDAVLGTFPADGVENSGMDIRSDLAHNDYASDADNAYHYQGAIQRALSDDQSTYLYYVTDSTGAAFGLGAARADRTWLSQSALNGLSLTWNGGQLALGALPWAGGWSWTGGSAWDSRFSWTGRFSWRGNWSASNGWTWDGRFSWRGGDSWAGRFSWRGSNGWSSGLDPTSTNVASTRWVDEK